jgi:hypothetical protein
MQRLLTTARWDADALRDDVRGYVVEHHARDPARPLATLGITLGSSHA